MVRSARAVAWPRRTSAEARQGRHDRQGEIALDRGAQHQPVALAVLGDQGQPGALGRERRADPDRLAVDADLATGGLRRARRTGSPGARCGRRPSARRGRPPRRRPHPDRRHRPGAAAAPSAAGWPATSRAPTAPSARRSRARRPSVASRLAAMEEFLDVAPGHHPDQPAHARSGRSARCRPARRRAAR